MKKNRKKLWVIVLIIAVFLAGIPFTSLQKATAQESEFSDPNSTFNYDSSAFSRYVACRKHYTINASSDATFTTKGFLGIGKKTTTLIKKGEAVGDVIIRSYWLYPKTKINNYYYSQVHFEVAINGTKSSTDSNMRGLPVNIEIGFATPNPESQIVLPAKAPITAVVNSSDSETSSHTFQFGIGVGAGGSAGASVESNGQVSVTAEKKLDASGSFGYTYNLSKTSSNSITFEYTGSSYAPRTCTYINGTRYADWEYGYDYSTAMKMKDLLSFTGTSYRTGQVIFRDSARNTVTGTKMQIYYEFQFSEGYTKGSKKDTMLQVGKEGSASTYCVTMTGTDSFSY